MNDQTTGTDRIAEIRARFDASERALRGQEQAVGRTAPSGILRVSDDIAWLLARVEELQGQLDKARENQVGMARAYAASAQGEELRAGKFEWNASHSLAYAQGEARGAGSTVMFLLMELGEVEYDEAAETTWDVVMGAEARDDR